MMNDNHNYLQGMKRKVGWFMLLGLGTLLFMLLITGARSNFFAKKFYVYVQPPTAASIHEGLPVRFQGFGIGHVDLVELLEQGKVRVTLQLLDRYRPMLHQGAVVKLSKEGWLGEQFVRISAGQKDAPILENKMMLRFESEVSVEQLLQELQPSVEQVDKLLSELVNIAEWANDPEGTLHSSMANINSFTDSLRGEEITTMLGDLQKIVGEIKREHLMRNLSHALDSTAVTLDEVKPLMHELGQKGGGTLEKMDELLLRMQKLATSLDVVSSDASEFTPELPGLARELRESLSESQLLMRTIRQSWLFGGSDEKEEQELTNMRSPPAVDLRP